MKKIIGDFELVDHGLVHSQYFRGCGVAFTNFTNVVTGVGDNAKAAVEHLLEQVAQDDWEMDGLEERLLEEAGLEEWPESPSASEGVELSEDSELYYHLSLRWKEKPNYGPLLA